MDQQTVINELTFLQPFGAPEKQLLAPEKQLLAPEKQLLTPAAIDFLTALVEQFAGPYDVLLNARVERQLQIDQGILPDFMPETISIRKDDWKIQGIPADLLDRRVEITGPVERKMIINALNANVKVFMADFEDSLSPAWEKLIEGQINLRDAVNGTISFINKQGKVYQLKSDPAVLMARVRGLHLPEKHILYRGKAIPGALLDFALYFFHNYKKLLEKGSGPYFYIPKLESYKEAQWWSEVFSYTEERYGLSIGTIKATVLIETLPAVFQMDEILYYLRHHIVGLNCGRWDYIFSYIKTLKEYDDRVLPDRQAVTMTQPFLNAYSRLLIRTCHRRGAFAMGGMSAFIPTKDQTQNEAVWAKVKADKELEVKNGHDGTWIAHPALADIATAVFNETLAGRKNQLDVMRENDEAITTEQLLQPCNGERTEEGMRANIRIAVQYIEAWISGNGCVPIYGLMEDAATAEISRTSIWLWIRHQKRLSNGQKITKELFLEMLDEELQTIQQELGDVRFQHGRFREAVELMISITTQDELIEFLTLAGYQQLD